MSSPSSRSWTAWGRRIPGTYTRAPGVFLLGIQLVMVAEEKCLRPLPRRPLLENAMRRRLTSVWAGTAAAGVACTLAGCSTKQDKGTLDRRVAETCAADIHSAAYTGTGPNGPSSRTEVLVNGACFKPGAQPEDCETRQPDHPVASERQWRKCDEVLSSGSLMYHVKVYHSAAYDRVEIRVRGQDGEWSNAKTIDK